MASQPLHWQWGKKKHIGTSKCGSKSVKHVIYVMGGGGKEVLLVQNLV